MSRGPEMKQGGRPDTSFPPGRNAGSTLKEAGKTLRLPTVARSPRLKVPPVGRHHEAAETHRAGQGGQGQRHPVRLRLTASAGGKVFPCLAPQFSGHFGHPPAQGLGNGQVLGAGWNSFRPPAMVEAP